jgi:hypothetical protein
VLAERRIGLCQHAQQRHLGMPGPRSEFAQDLGSAGTRSGAHLLIVQDPGNDYHGALAIRLDFCDGKNNRHATTRSSRRVP